MQKANNQMAIESTLLEKTFHLSEQGTTVKREILAGLTTFVSMAYILFVNPSILGAAGMDLLRPLYQQYWEAS